METTNFPGGVTNAKKGQILANYPHADPTRVYQYWNDFTAYDADDWTVRSMGTPSQALVASAAGGELQLTNTAAGASDQSGLQLKPTGFLLPKNKKCWAEFRLKVSEADKSFWHIGLAAQSTAPFNAQNRLHFRSLNTDTNVDLVLDKAGVFTSDINDIAPVPVDTFITLGWYFDTRSITAFVNGAVAAKQEDITTYPDNVLMTPGFGITNSQAGVESMTIDYFFAAVER